MTDAHLISATVSVTLQNECHCPPYALDAAIAATVPYVAVINGAVAVTGGIRASGSQWVPVTGTDPRYAFDGSGAGSTDLPVSIGALVRELGMCATWPGRWRPAGTPLY